MRVPAAAALAAHLNAARANAPEELVRSARPLGRDQRAPGTLRVEDRCLFPTPRPRYHSCRRRQLCDANTSPAWSLGDRGVGRLEVALRRGQTIAAVSLAANRVLA